MEAVYATERGWPGHFICASRCLYRRNTLLSNSSGTVRIVVSTVGGLLSRGEDSFETIGHERYYETMVFHASDERGYWEADVSREVPFESQWCIDTHSYETDKLAEEMHRRVCDEISGRMAAGEFTHIAASGSLEPQEVK
jgi:hypothetical protein